MDIGRNISKIRKKRKISRKELAKKTGVPYQTLNNIEAGRVKEPGIVALIKIAQALEISLDTLVLHRSDKGLKVTIPDNICCLLHTAEIKKFFSLIEAIDVKGIKDLKKFSGYFRKIIDKVEISKGKSSLKRGR